MQVEEDLGIEVAIDLRGGSELDEVVEITWATSLLEMLDDGARASFGFARAAAIEGFALVAEFKLLSALAEVDATEYA